MNDNFYPSVTWDIPISEKEQVHLTKVYRSQNFITWLAALNETTGELVVLKTIKWQFNLEITVDPSQPLGKRATLSSNSSNFTESTELSLLRQLDTLPKNIIPNENVPICAMMRPSANHCQILHWYPKVGRPAIVVPPKEVWKKNQKLVIFSGKAVAGKKEKQKQVVSLSKETVAKMKKDVQSRKKVIKEMIEINHFLQKPKLSSKKNSICKVNSNLEKLALKKSLVVTE